MPRLVVEKGKDKGKSLLLRENMPFLIGRDLKTHLRLRDHQVSRRHLKITYKQGEVRLEDLDSSNGSFVNGARVRSVALSPNDKIQVGETLIFYLEDESQDDAAPPTEDVVAPRPERIRKGELTDKDFAGYKVGRLLGRGGMGTVYEALQVSLERRVAFKVLAAELAADSQFVDRFTAEARAAGQLNHPNIVQVYDVGVATPLGGGAQVRFYSMEFMAGGSVEDLLRKEGRLTVERALPIVFDAARGLEYAERHGVVHRDIKPDNLMISEDHVVKIGDLGIATRRRAAEQADQEEGVSGSPHYMAPEQAMGRAIDHRADLYALGVSLYQMLSGETPYEGASAREVILKHLNEPAPPLQAKCPHLTPEVVSLVERLMEKDPTKRLASASVLLQELVPLVKKFPVAESSRVRIDGIIAQRTELQVASTAEAKTLPTTELRAPVNPKAETAELPTSVPKPPRLVPVSRAALIKLVVVLGSLALGVIAFKAVRAVRDRIEVAKAARAQAIDEVRAVLEKDPVECERRAKELVVKFEREGYRADAEAANGIVKEAGDRIAAREEEAHRKAAALAFKEALDKVNEAANADTTPEKVDYYKLAVDIWDKLAEKWSGTAEAERAIHNAQVARDGLATAQRSKGERDEREARAGKSLQLAHDAIKAAYKETRFADACVLIDNFEAEHGKTSVAQRAVPELRKELGEEARRAWKGVQEKVNAAVSGKRWEDARLLLDDFARLFKDVPALAPFLKDIDAERRRVDGARKQDAINQAVSADQKTRQEAEQKARSLVDDRRFRDASEALESAAASIRASPTLQADLEKHASRLREAQGAIDDLVVAIKGGKHVSYQGQTVEDASSSRIHLKGAKDVPFGQITPEELHGLVLQAAGRRAEADALIHAAALALELGDRDSAATDLNHASEGKPTDREQARIDALKSP